MPRRSPAAPALCSGVIALLIALNSNAAANAAADCLTAPNQAPSDGRHWYFRTDRDTNKKCWYLRDGEAATTGSIATQPRPQPDTIAADQPIATPLSKGQQEALFAEFLRWQKQRHETQ
jgi:hypothetical protein